MSLVKGANKPHAVHFAHKVPVFSSFKVLAYDITPTYNTYTM